MSILIPLPKHSLPHYREYLNALEHEFFIDTPFQKIETRNLARLWTSYLDAARQYAEHADLPGTNDHHLARMRANRRALNLLASLYSRERDKVTATLRRRIPEPPDTGRAIQARRSNGTGQGRGGTHGNSGSSTRVHDVYARMKREQQ